MPKFTVVIPTQNRPHTLHHAIDSISKQNYTDYEIVIQDNASDERTAQVVEQFTSLPLIYNYSETNLSHQDNWEQAINLATGDYITFLGDDDALMPDALERLDKILSESNPDLVTWPAHLYYWPDIENHNLKNTLSVSSLIEPTVKDDWSLSQKIFNITSLTNPAPDYTYWICSRAAEHNWYTWADNRLYANINHGLVSRKLVEKHKHLFSRFFIDPMVDYGNILSSLHLTDQFLYVKQSITMNGHSGASAGGTHGSRHAFRKKIETFSKQNGLSLIELNGEGHVWVPAMLGKWLQRCGSAIKGKQNMPTLDMEKFLNWAANSIPGEPTETQIDCIKWVEEQAKTNDLVVSIPQTIKASSRPRGPQLDKSARTRGIFIDGDIAGISNIIDATKLAHAMSFY